MNSKNTQEIKKGILLGKLSQLALGLLSLSVIFFVNYWLVGPWLKGQGPVNLGSIEVSYVSMARFLRDFSPHLSFAPYWYFGFPFHLFYTPILPVLTSLLHQLSGFPLWQAYRIVTGAGFVLAPISLFFFTWQLTKKIIPGVLAALGFSFLPSLFYYVLPSGEVAQDMISQGFFDPRRLVILARWGEGPHTLSLVFLPLAGLFYLRVLEKKRRRDIFLAALFLGLTALTNAVGFYPTILLLLAIFFAEWVEKPKKLKRTFRLSLMTTLLAYGLIAFWYNLSFIGTFFGEGGGVLANYLGLFPWGWLLALFIGAGLYFFCQKIVKNRVIITALAWFLILFLTVYVYYTSAPPEFSEQRIELVPQALRLTVEADMALAVFLAVIVGAIISFLEKRKSFVFKILGYLIGWGLVAGLLSYGGQYLPLGQAAFSGEVDLSQTAEYEISQWLEGRVEQKKGERVYLAGNYGFYLNYFTNIWQLRGGLFQAMTHHWPGHIYYQLSKGKSEEIALAWLKAANIRYLVVNTSASRDLYKDYSYPEKFTTLPVVYEERGDIIYQLSNSEPVKVVDLGIMEGLAAPEKADDKKPLLAYTQWLDQASWGAFTVVNNDSYKIKARVGQNQGVLVQMTADSGFRARSPEGKWKIKKDPLGFMVLVPPVASSQIKEYEVTLVHGKSGQIWLGYLITLVTVISLIILPFLKKVSSHTTSEVD